MGDLGEGLNELRLEEEEGQGEDHEEAGLDRGPNEQQEHDRFLRRTMHDLFRNIREDDVKGLDGVLDDVRQLVDRYIFLSEGVKGGCGYIEIRKLWKARWNTIDEETNYADIQRYILEPFVDITEYEDIELPDNDNMDDLEATIQLILNRALKKASGRLNRVQGYWELRLRSEFPEEKLARDNLKVRIEKIRKNLEQIPEGYTLELIDKVTLEQVEAFNSALKEIERAIRAFPIGLAGAMNCGSNYSDYNESQHTFTTMYFLNNQGKTNYDPILLFVLLPLAILPSDTVMNTLDNPRVPKTFSEEILNLALKKASERLNFVRGYWELRLRSEFPEEKLARDNLKEEKEKIRNSVRQIPEGYKVALFDEVAREQVETFNSVIEEIERGLGSADADTFRETLREIREE